jgi:hypothetical protein
MCLAPRLHRRSAAYRDPDQFGGRYDGLALLRQTLEFLDEREAAR